MPQADGSATTEGTVQVLVVVAESHLDRIADVAERLARAGLVEERRLEATGMLTGAIGRRKVDSLRGLDGVASVEIDRSIQLPPPDSEVQ